MNWDYYGLVLAFLVLHLVTCWRFSRTLEKAEDRADERFRQAVSLLSGKPEPVRYLGVDPGAKSLVQAAREDGSLNDVVQQFDEP